MKKHFLVSISVLLINVVYAQHPSIMLTKKMVEEVRAGITKYPLLTSSYKNLKADADKALARPINVPTPADGGGGITHEQHKKNYQNALACGTVYQLSKDARYAKYVKDLLLKYAAVYKTWPRHPKRKQEPGGRIFWQNLNDNVWGVYMIQGYDCVYDALSKDERSTIENDLFAEMVKELSETNSKIFNLVHNHATWSVAAVGMAGYVCGRKDWVDIALHGSNKDDKSGFLSQINQLFSPDGYYMEGPYYQRYAILPFMVFARAIQQHQPELKIYDYRNGILKKAVNTSLQSTYTNKVFFPLNDALKDKTYESEELVYAVDLAYGDFTSGNDLLDIAQQQKRVIVSDAGLKVAKAIAEGKTVPFVYKPMWISDGSEGKEGGIGVLRSGPNTNQTCVVMKAASQGMGHGHFDRLNTIFFDNGVEVLDDYGSVRFLNVETKTGGGYTKENDTWAKATVAHNTLVVDKRSQYNSNVEEASKYSPSLVYFDANKQFQVVCALEEHAYTGVKMLRTNILFQPLGAAEPLLLDVFKVTSAQKHQYDLPFWYTGHLTNINFQYKSNQSQLTPAGDKDGYQHIWLNAEGKTGTENGAITFLNNSKFYTTSFLTDASTKVSFISTGANDPNFNLRNEKAYMITQPSSGDHTFVNITEPHGKNNPIAEFTTGFMPSTKNIRLIEDTVDKTVFTFEYNKTTYTVQLRYNNKNQFVTIINN
ncbi:MAG: heparinase II/III family protein [Sediminibacterium sp.]